MKIRRTLDDMMSSIGKLINGVLANPDILEKVIPYGYTEERIRTEGLAKYEYVQSLILLQKKEYGDQYEAKNVYENLWSAASDVYMSILKLSRIALKNKPGILHSIGANGNRKRTLTGFLKEARMLYGNLLGQPEAMNEMVKWGVSKEKLETASAGIDELDASYIAYNKERGEAQDATVKRDNEFDELYEWYSDFRAVTRIAVNDSTQLLEKLGIVVK